MKFHRILLALSAHFLLLGLGNKVAAHPSFNDHGAFPWTPETAEEMADHAYATATIQQITTEGTRSAPNKGGHLQLVGVPGGDGIPRASVKLVAVPEVHVYHGYNEPTPGPVPNSVWHGDFKYKLITPSRTIVARFPTAEIDGFPSYTIDPLIDGWSGALTVQFYHFTNKLIYTFTASWNFEEAQCGCDAGNCHSSNKLGSVDSTIPIGYAENGSREISLLYESELITNQGAAQLKLDGSTSGVGAVVTEANGHISTVTVGDRLARILPDPSAADPNRFQILVSTDAAAPAGSLYRVLTYENLASGAFQITETVDGITSTYLYETPSSTVWKLTENDARRTTRTVTSETATLRVTDELIEEKDAQNT